MKGIDTDGPLIDRLCRGDQGAFDRLKPRLEGILWRGCLARSATAKLAEEAVLEIWPQIFADDCLRLRQWDRRGPFDAYLTIVVSDLLIRRIESRLATLRALVASEAGAPELDVASEDCWIVFIGYFETLIRSRIARRYARENERDDVYQDSCLALYEKRCGRLRAFSGGGHLVGYVGKAVDRLLLDGLRKQIGRRRLPEAVRRMPALEQAVYTALYWDGVPADPDRLALAVSGQGVKPGRAEIVAALKLVSAHAPKPKGGRLVTISLAMGDDDDGEGIDESRIAANSPSPADEIEELEEAELRQAALEVLRNVIAAMDGDARAYVEAALAGTKPRHMPWTASRIASFKYQFRRDVRAAVEQNQDASLWLANLQAMGAGS